jgi:two-component system, OmpR family, response regulator
MHILVVEDAENLRRALVHALRAEGYSVQVAVNALEAQAHVQQYAFDAAVVGFLLRGMNGVVLCRELRAEGFDAPMLLLVTNSWKFDEPEALDAGVDAIMVEPFDLTVLAARLRALLRRGPLRLPPVLAHGAIELDLARRRCIIDSTEVYLTPRQFSLLRYLLAHADATHSVEDLVTHVRGGASVDRSIVASYVHSLRRKLDKPGKPSFLNTVRGAGYRLAAT